MLLLVAVLTRFAYPEYFAPTVRSDTWFTLAYLQNWHQAVWHGALRSPLAHTWSLSVEEQWYLVWPVVLTLLLRWFVGRWRQVLAVIIGLAVASAVWASRVAATSGLVRAYRGTDTHAQELLIGAALAVVLSMVGTTLTRRARRFVGIAGPIALLAIVGSAIGIAQGPRWFNGGFFVLALGTALVITAAMQPDGMVRRVLAVGPLVLVGRWSYGIYLYHLPLFVFLDSERTGLDGAALLMLRVAVSLAVAAVSFVLIEQPIRHGRFSGRRLIAVGVLAAVGVVAATTIGFAGPTPQPRSKVLRFVLHEAALKAPRDATKVLVVGGSRAALLGFVTKGPYDANGIYGLALGTNDCGLTSGDVRCSAVPGDLAAIVDAFGAEVVVLMADERDAVGGAGTGSHDRTHVVRRLDQMRAAVGGRRMVILPIPCATASGAAPETTARSFNAVLARWAKRNGEKLIDPSPQSCTPSSPPASLDDQWRALASAVGVSASGVR